MPHPTKRTPEVAAILLGSLAEGKKRPEALMAAGLDDNTLYRWMKDDPAFKEAVAWAEVDGAFAASPIIRLLEEGRRQREEAYERARQRWEKAGAGDPSCLDGAPARQVDALKVRMGTHCVEDTPGSGGRLVRHVWKTTKRARRRPLCGARTRKGTACQARALPGKRRCKWHGGASTGPKTEAGKAAIAAANRRRARRGPAWPCVEKGLEAP